MLRVGLRGAVFRRDPVHHILARGVDADAVFANSIVSSRLLAALAHAAGVRHEETLTGFKWIARVPGLRYGYEEALGYCVDPEGVRDKDGITAALLITELASTLKAEGRTLLDLLDDLALGGSGLLPTEGLRYRLAEGARVVVRPSGTEPKLKCYLEVVVPVHPDDGVDAARISAAGRLDAIKGDVRRALGL